jgi:tungstate transport system permease protein
LEGIKHALELLFTLDREVYASALFSLRVASTATLISIVIGVPLGVLVTLKNFWGKGIVVTILNTLMALPTVVIGLLVFSFISRQGPLGQLGLLYTPTAIVIGEIILATPIIAALTLSATSAIDGRVRETALSLGATPFQSLFIFLLEGRFGLCMAIIAGFGRVIAEVGSAMMLGGNIRFYTRTLTTTIVLETAKGEFGVGLSLGLILLFISFSINILFHYLQGRGRE